MIYVYELLIILASYLLGSIPTGYWIVLLVKGIDIRTIGSGSTGATNVLRAVGKGPALFVFFADIGKGCVPVLIAMMLEPALWSAAPFNIEYLIPSIVAMVAIVGHSRSIFLKFTGGKSAATTLGALFGLNPIVAGLTFGTWLAVLSASRIVSLASIVAAVACPVYMYINHVPVPIFGFSLLASIYVVVRHKANIKRLIEGKEPRLGRKPAVPSEGSGNDAKTADSEPESQAAKSAERSALEKQ